MGNYYYSRLYYTNLLNFNEILIWHGIYRERTGIVEWKYAIWIGFNFASPVRRSIIYERKCIQCIYILVGKIPCRRHSAGYNKHLIMVIFQFIAFSIWITISDFRTIHRNDWIDIDVPQYGYHKWTKINFAYHTYYIIWF